MRVEGEIVGIRPTVGEPAVRPERTGASGAGAFSGELGRAVQALDRLQIEADVEARRTAEGGGNLHELAIALEKADVAMRLAMKVRTKIVDAYNEIMRMGI